MEKQKINREWINGWSDGRMDGWMPRDSDRDSQGAIFSLGF